MRSAKLTINQARPPDGSTGIPPASAIRLAIVSCAASGMDRRCARGRHAPLTAAMPGQASQRSGRGPRLGFARNTALSQIAAHLSMDEATFQQHIDANRPGGGELWPLPRCQKQRRKRSDAEASRCGKTPQRRRFRCVRPAFCLPPDRSPRRYPVRHQPPPNHRRLGRAQNRLLPVGPRFPQGQRSEQGCQRLLACHAHRPPARVAIGSGLCPNIGGSVVPGHQCNTIGTMLTPFTH